MQLSETATAADQQKIKKITCLPNLILLCFRLCSLRFPNTDIEKFHIYQALMIIKFSHTRTAMTSPSLVPSFLDYHYPINACYELACDY